MKMVDKKAWYYKNLVTGEITDNKETRKDWNRKGINVGHIHWSNVCKDFIIYMIEEGQKQNFMEEV